jgi:hypothetical protein
MSVRKLHRQYTREMICAGSQANQGGLPAGVPLIYEAISEHRVISVATLQSLVPRLGYNTRPEHHREDMP